MAMPSRFRSRSARPLVLAAALACVASQGARSDDSDLPAVNTQGAITYITGGIGGPESDAIKAAAPGYALTLTFASRVPGSRDVYLADVPVTIRNGSGATVLDVTTDGPYLLVNNLPAGTYKIVAKYKGTEKSSTVKIAAGGHQKLSMVWSGVDTQASPPIVPAPAQTVITTTPDGRTATVTTTTTPGTAAATAPATTPTPIADADPVVPSVRSVPSAQSVETAAARAAATAAASASPPPSVPVSASVAASTTADEALPEVKTQGGIPYLSGGIGSDESAAIKAAQSRYSLSVTFSSRQDGKDVYQASVPVKVRDATGTIVLDIVTDGPFLLADLLPGSYTVTASVQGVEKQSTAKIAAGQHIKVTMAWDLGH